MTATETRVYRLGEFHRSKPAGAVFSIWFPRAPFSSCDDAAEKLDRPAVERRNRARRSVRSWWREAYSYDDAEELARRAVSTRA